MNKINYAIFALILFFASCEEDEPIIMDNETPTVQSESSFPVLIDENVIYAEGLGHTNTSTSSMAVPLLLDIYYPDNNSTNRPVFMFIHGGGFQGGTKTKPEIVNMANYYASRGWVFASIDYRTVEELGTIMGMTSEEVLTFHKGIAPEEWINFSLQNAMSPDEVQTSVAIYAAQRDAKAALRWIIANSATYSLNKDFITIGGASAGAISTIALGISNQDNFRDELSIDDDSTLSSTNIDEHYDVKSMIYFWGADIKIELYEAIYGVNLYDINDPELFMAHGTMDVNPSTPFSEATELKDIYDSIGIYNELVPLEGAGHGAWNAQVDGKGLNELTFDFLVDRQNLNVE